MGSHACMQFSMLRVGLGAKDWTSDTTLEKIDFFGARAITSPSLPEEEFLNLPCHCTACTTAQKPPSAALEPLGQASQRLLCPSDLSAAATHVGEGRLETTSTGSHWQKEARLYHWVLKENDIILHLIYVSIISATVFLIYVSIVSAIVFL